MGDMAADEPPLEGAALPIVESAVFLFKAPRSMVDGRVGVFGLRVRNGSFTEEISAHLYAVARRRASGLLVDTEELDWAMMLSRRPGTHESLR